MLKIYWNIWKIVICIGLIIKILWIAQQGVDYIIYLVYFKANYQTTRTQYLEQIFEGLTVQSVIYLYKVHRDVDYEI